MAKKKASSEKKSPAPSKLAKGAGPMDPALLEQLVKLMSANDLSSLDLRDGNQRVSLKRGPQVVTTSAAPVYHAPTTTPNSGGATSVAPKSEAPKAPVDDTAGLKPIKSPMVGTFYSAPSPGAKPFVSVGSQVDDETDVCVIEAMKVFNNIKAETRGTIAKVLVQNGATVEYGTVLFLVKPA
jgi:acetyl-CoA carboxylase biotin carboxyl carrier protein